MKHKHAELIKAWADGAEIEYRTHYKTWSRWIPLGNTGWDEADYIEYRIKPKPKPDIEHHYFADWATFKYEPKVSKHNLKLTFDGETGELKSAEVLK